MRTRRIAVGVCVWVSVHWVVVLWMCNGTTKGANVHLIVPYPTCFRNIVWTAISERAQSPTDEKQYFAGLTRHVRTRVRCASLVTTVFPYIVHYLRGNSLVREAFCIYYHVRSSEGGFLLLTWAQSSLCRTARLRLYIVWGYPCGCVCAGNKVFCIFLSSQS